MPNAGVKMSNIGFFNIQCPDVIWVLKMTKVMFIWVMRKRLLEQLKVV